jgi:glycosyltransferase involved in cell wall biosynthesis
MKIVFFPADCCPFHGKTLEERPLGGTETGVIRLAEALDALGHDVQVMTPIPNPPLTKPRYLSFKEAMQLEGIDALIVVRGWKGVFLPFKAQKRFFWTGDAHDNLHTLGIGDQRFIKRVGGLLTVSDWHTQTLCQTSGFPIDKTFILRNGVRLQDFAGEEKRQRKRLIYSSIPSRGLIHLPEIFLELKRRHADLELAIFSSFSLYRPHWPPLQTEEGDYERVLERIRSLPGCHEHGNIPQGQLAREFMKSAIWAYPTHFEETSCITAMEAQAGGCAIITSALAALPEVVADAGILIEGKAGSEAYRHHYIEACDRVLSDDVLYNQLSQKALQRAQGFDWKIRAQSLIHYLQTVHSLK